MVKLLDSFIHPSQLLRQAEFINWLETQRDLLVQSFEEERKRWEVEREGWTRMAEALLAQRANAGNTSVQRDEDLERQYATYESENKNLREKVSSMDRNNRFATTYTLVQLQDSQLRFSALESELNKLKPLLLMQPLSSISGISSSDRLSAFQTESVTDSRSSKTKRKHADPSAAGEQEHSGSMTDPKPLLPQTHPGDSTRIQFRSEHYHRNSQSRLSFLSPLQPRSSVQQTPTRSVFSSTQTPQTHSGSPKKPKSKNKKSLHSNLLPLTADARTEHLLLAARRIGRERANMMSGFMRRIEKEKEEMVRENETERMERESMERAATGSAGVGGNTYYRKDLANTTMSPGPATSPTIVTMPQTPKRGTAGGHSTTHFLTPTLMTPRTNFYPSTNHTPSSFVFVGTPAVASFGNSAPTSRQIGNSVPSAHSVTQPTQTPAAPSTSATHANNRPTPLASLLSAAKSMMDDDAHDSNINSNGRRRAGALELPETPLPKRRRVRNGSLSNGARTVDMLGATATPSTDRVRSALDVLADQAAAAFDSDRHSPTKSPTKPPTRSKGKNKGSMLARSGVSGEPPEAELDGDSTPKGKTRSMLESRSHVSTGSPVSTRSRSKALLTDRLSKESTRAKHKRDKSLDSQQRSASTPRMIFSPGIRSPIAPQPTLSDAVSADIDSGPASERASVHTEAGRAEEDLVDDGNISLINGVTNTLSKPPTSSRAGDDCRAISGSLPLDVTNRCTPDSQPDAVVEGFAQKDQTLTAINPTTTFAWENGEGGAHSTIIQDSAPQGEGNPERAPPKEGEVGGVGEEHGKRSHAGRSPSGDSPDTDADAEGEMDVDAEVTITSSMVHEPLSLAAPLPRPEVSSSIPAGLTRDEQNPGAPRAILSTKP